MIIYQVEYLRERDADVDDHCVGGVVDGAKLPVVVPHEVEQQMGLVLQLTILQVGFKKI